MMIECQNRQKWAEFWQLLLSAFIQGSKSTKSTQEICNVYREEAPLHKELHRNGFHTSSGTSTSQTLHIRVGLFSSMRTIQTNLPIGIYTSPADGIVSQYHYPSHLYSVSKTQMFSVLNEKKKRGDKNKWRKKNKFIRQYIFVR